MEFAMAVPKMLREANLGSVIFKTAYVCPLAICHCTKERKVMCEFEGPDGDTLRTALAKIGLSATAILAKPN
jgi:hypothetical protein